MPKSYSLCNFVDDFAILGKGKGKRLSSSSDFLTQQHAMKAYWGVDV
jgi:hypothetical protein